MNFSAPTHCYRVDNIVNPIIDAATRPFNDLLQKYLQAGGHARDPVRDQSTHMHCASISWWLRLGTGASSAAECRDARVADRSSSAPVLQPPTFPSLELPALTTPTLSVATLQVQINALNE